MANTNTMPTYTTAATSLPSRRAFRQYFRARWQNMQNIVNDTVFYALVPPRFLTYYRAFIEQWLDWARGFVPQLHRQEFFSTGIGYTVCDIFARECMSGGWRIDSKDEQTAEQLPQTANGPAIDDMLAEIRLGLDEFPRIEKHRTADGPVNYDGRKPLAITDYGIRCLLGQILDEEDSLEDVGKLSEQFRYPASDLLLHIRQDSVGNLAEMSGGYRLHLPLVFRITRGGCLGSGNQLVCNAPERRNDDNHIIAA